MSRRLKAAGLARVTATIPEDRREDLKRIVREWNANVPVGEHVMRFRVPLTYADYCAKLRIDPNDPASKQRYRAYYVKFRGD